MTEEDHLHLWQLELNNPCPHRLAYPLEPKPPGDDVIMCSFTDWRETVRCVGCGMPAPKTMVYWMHLRRPER